MFSELSKEANDLVWTIDKIKETSRGGVQMPEKYFQQSIITQQTTESNRLHRATAAAAADWRPR